MRTIYFPPLFDEHKCSYRFSYCLSKAFEEQGIVLERPDYRGTGESEEQFYNVTLDSLRDDLENIIPKTRCCLIGLRFGASLAYDYALRYSEIDHRLVLIEPIMDGEQYIDYLLRKQRLKDHMTGTPQDCYREEDYVNIEGYKTNLKLLYQVRRFYMQTIPGHLGIQLILTRKNISKLEMDYITLLKTLNHMAVNKVELPDYWERIPIIDYSALIKYIMEYYDA